MEHESSQKSYGYGYAPHTDDKAVHIEQGVAAAVEHAVYRDCINAPAYHVDRHYHHHARKVASCLVRELYEVHHKGRYRKYQGCGDKADDKGDIFQLQTVGLACFEPACAQFIADDDTCRTAYTVADAADKVSDDRCHRICGSSVRADMTDYRCIGSKAHSPEKRTAHQGDILL